MLHDAMQPHGHRRHQTNVEGPRLLSEKAAATAADEKHIAAFRQIIHGLSECLEVALRDAAGPKTLKHPGWLLVDLFQLGLGYAKPDGLLLQQLPIIDPHLQSGCKRWAEARVPGPQLACQGEHTLAAWTA